MDASEIESILEGGRFLTDPTAIARRMLLRDLRKLNIRPLKQEDVNAWKKSKVALTRAIANTADVFTYLTIPVYLVASLLVTIMSAVSAQVSGNAFGPSASAALVFVAGFGIAYVASWGFHQVFKAFNGSRWDYTELNLYQDHLNRSVPADVEQLAGRLRHARPEIGIKVEFFKLDPFLVAYDYYHPEAFFTIAVWDESGYRIAYA